MTRAIVFSGPVGPYGFLHNHYRSPFVLDAQVWWTVEHRVQTVRAAHADDRGEIERARDPRYVAVLGRHVEPRPDWEAIKVPVMLETLRAKFNQWPAVGEQLLATGDAPLHLADPTDPIWSSHGQDLLGRCLVAVRSTLRPMAKAPLPPVHPLDLAAMEQGLVLNQGSLATHLGSEELARHAWEIFETARDAARTGDRDALRKYYRMSKRLGLD